MKQKNKKRALPSKMTKVVIELCIAILGVINSSDINITLNIFS